MSSFDYNCTTLAESILGEVKPAVATSVRHNLAILRAVHWGAREVLNSTLDFDPRADWWRRPERRFLVAFLADTWPDWPEDSTTHLALERFCVALSRGLDELRERGEITFNGADYASGGGIPKVLSPLARFLRQFDSSDWKHCRPSRYTSMDAAEALLGFLDRVARNGFTKNEHTLQRQMRWWAALGARSPEELQERQRFFWAYRLLLCTINAYTHAGAQKFGPFIGNTAVGV